MLHKGNFSFFFFVSMMFRGCSWLASTRWSSENNIMIGQLCQQARPVLQKRYNIWQVSFLGFVMQFRLEPGSLANVNFSICPYSRASLPREHEPVWNGKCLSDGIICPLHNSSICFLSKENHPDLPLIKSKQDEVNAAWDRLHGFALQRRKTLSDAADLQRFKRYESRHCISTMSYCQQLVANTAKKTMGCL